MQIKNLCGNSIVIFLPEKTIDIWGYKKALDRQIIEFPAEEQCIKLIREADYKLAPITFDGKSIPLIRYGKYRLSNLPDPAPGIMYIVTEFVAAVSMVQGRTTEDLLIPSGEVYIHLDDGEKRAVYTKFKQL